MMAARVRCIKVFLFLLAGILSTATGSFAQDKTVLTVAYVKMGHHVTGEGSPPPGSAAAYLIQYVMPRWNKNVTLRWMRESVNVPRAIMQVKRGMADMILMLSKTPEREKVLKYAATPLIFGKQSGLAVPAESPLVSIKSVADIAHLQIGYQTGAFLSPFMRDSRIKMTPVMQDNFFSINLRLLEMGRIDAVYGPDIDVLEYLAAKEDIAHKLRFLALPDAPTSTYTVFSPTIDDSMIDSFSQALRAAQQEIPYEKFMVTLMK